MGPAVLQVLEGPDRTSHSAVMTSAPVSIWRSNWKPGSASSKLQRKTMSTSRTSPKPQTCSGELSFLVITMSPPATGIRRTKEVYRTKRFKKLIKAEAETSDQQVFADLGSGGELPTSHLQFSVTMVCRLDKAPAMVSSVDTGESLQSWRAKRRTPTSPKAPSNSSDMPV